MEGTRSSTYIWTYRAWVGREAQKILAPTLLDQVLGRVPVEGSYLGEGMGMGVFCRTHYMGSEIPQHDAFLNNNRRLLQQLQSQGFSAFHSSLSKPFYYGTSKIQMVDVHL